MASANLLVGRYALVTGAASGIGRAVCRVLAREGAKIIATDRDETGAKQTVDIIGGEGHIAAGLDVSKLSSIQNVVKQALDKFSQPPSIIINSAGITDDNFILRMTDEAFQKVIDVNLRGTFLVTQTAVSTMVEANLKNGAIVNLASISGKIGNMGQGNYAASKAGVVALTKVAAREFAHNSLRHWHEEPNLFGFPEQRWFYSILRGDKCIFPVFHIIFDRIEQKFTSTLCSI